jgi:ABC-type metal ion transport system substrate-binding protein
MKTDHLHFITFMNINTINTTLANDQLDAQIFNTYIAILYMFRAVSC